MKTRLNLEGIFVFNWGERWNNLSFLVKEKEREIIEGQKQSKFVPFSLFPSLQNELLPYKLLSQIKI